MSLVESRTISKPPRAYAFRNALYLMFGGPVSDFGLFFFSFALFATLVAAGQIARGNLELEPALLILLIFPVAGWLLIYPQMVRGWRAYTVYRVGIGVQGTLLDFKRALFSTGRGFGENSYRRIYHVRYRFTVDGTEYTAQCRMTGESTFASQEESFQPSQQVRALYHPRNPQLNAVWENTFDLAVDAEGMPITPTLGKRIIIWLGTIALVLAALGGIYLGLTAEG